jgi:hypothetical protein
LQDADVNVRERTARNVKSAFVPIIDFRKVFERVR